MQWLACLSSWGVRQQLYSDKRQEHAGFNGKTGFNSVRDNNLGVWVCLLHRIVLTNVPEESGFDLDDAWLR